MPLKQVLAAKLSTAEECIAELREALIELHELRKRLATAEAENDRYRQNMAALMTAIGTPDTCPMGCRAPILWVRNRIDKAAKAYNADGVPHSATCPKANPHRKQTAGGGGNNG
jgi:hypothetical protein